jgi:hypothetical protein
LPDRDPPWRGCQFRGLEAVCCDRGFFASFPSFARTGPIVMNRLDGKVALISGPLAALATGQAYIDAPLTPPGIACRDVRARPPPDVLRGEPDDLLRGPGTPNVHVEMQ